MKTKYVLIFTFVFSLFYVSAQELALVRENGKFGFIDKSGAYVIEPQFDRAKSFSQQYAAVEKDKKWGFINTSGEWVIQPEYNKVKYFNSGYVLVLKDDNWQYIDAEGNKLETPLTDKYFDFNDGVALYRNQERIGLIGTDGKVIIEPSFDAVKKFRNGHAKVKRLEKWGMINKKGEVIIPTEYQELGNEFNVSGVEGRKGDTFGIISNGTFNVIDGADKVWGFKGNSTLTYARKGKKVGFVNNKGEWVIEPKFDRVKAFSKGLAPVANGKMWGYIDEKGEMVIPASFRDAEIFSDGLAPVKVKKWGFIDITGKLVIPMEYDISAGLAFIAGKQPKGFKNGLARVKSKKGWAFLNEKGEVLAGKWFQNAENFVNTNE